MSLPRSEFERSHRATIFFLSAILAVDNFFFLSGILAGGNFSVLSSILTGSNPFFFTFLFFLFFSAPQISKLSYWLWLKMLLNIFTWLSV